MSELTPVQKRYLDVINQKKGQPTDPDLADPTKVHISEDLRRLTAERAKGNLEESTMSQNNSGEPIGAAQIAKDISNIVKKVIGK